MYEYPLISCFSTVFGRVKCLEEAIQCFLDQDYPGPKELVIVNDLPEQTLHCDHPEIKIYNMKKRFPTLGEKCNYNVEKTVGEILVVWDDDDIYLPNYISELNKLLLNHNGNGLMYPQNILQWHKHTPEKIIKNYRSTSSARQFFRDMFEDVGGYRSLSYKHDCDLEHRCRAKYGSSPIIKCDPEDSGFLWGSANNGHPHLSRRAFRVDHNYPTDRSGYIKFYDVIRNKIDTGMIPSGDIYLDPRYRRNYCDLFNTFLQTQDKCIKTGHTKYIQNNNVRSSNTIRSRFFY